MNIGITLYKQGSSNENLKTSSTDPEYDYMLALDCSELQDLKVIKDKCMTKACYAKLKLKSDSSHHFEDYEKDGYLSSRLITKMVHHHLTEYLTANRKHYPDIKPLKDHGPAIQVDVKSEGEKYSIDLVIGIEVNGSLKNEIYIPKPKFRQGQDKIWRQSFFKEEQKLLLEMEEFPLQVTRMVKAIRDKDTILSKLNLNSYLIKSTLFNLLRTDKFLSALKSGRLGKCLLYFLNDLRKSMVSRKLPHYFNMMHNLLIKHSSTDLMPEVQDIANRLEELICNEDELMKILNM